MPYIIYNIVVDVRSIYPGILLTSLRTTRTIHGPVHPRYIPCPLQNSMITPEINLYFKLSGFVRENVA